MNLLVQWNGNNIMNDKKVDSEDEMEKNDEGDWQDICNDSDNEQIEYVSSKEQQKFEKFTKKISSAS